MIFEDRADTLKNSVFFIWLLLLSQPHKLLNFSGFEKEGMWLTCRIMLRCIWKYVCKLHGTRRESESVCGSELCLTLCDAMECGPSGSSVHEILQARTLERVSIPFSRGSSQPRDQTQVSCIAGRFFNCLSHQGSPE